MVKVRNVKISSNFAGKVRPPCFVETFRIPVLRSFALGGGAKDREVLNAPRKACLCAMRSKERLMPYKRKARGFTMGDNKIDREKEFYLREVALIYREPRFSPSYAR